MRYILSLLLFVNTATAAPVPPQPPPKQLAEADVLGTWEYTWGAMRGGEIQFFADRTYRGRHQLNSPCYYHGIWWIDRYSNEYVFKEVLVSADGSVGSWGGTYRMQITSRDMPFEWRAKGGVELIFERRK